MCYTAWRCRFFILGKRPPLLPIKSKWNMTWLVICHQNWSQPLLILYIVWLMRRYLLLACYRLDSVKNSLETSACFSSRSKRLCDWFNRPISRLNQSTACFNCVWFNGVWIVSIAVDSRRATVESIDHIDSSVLVSIQGASGYYIDSIAMAVLFFM